MSADGCCCSRPPMPPVSGGRGPGRRTGFRSAVIPHPASEDSTKPFCVGLPGAVPRSGVILRPCQDGGRCEGCAELRFADDHAWRARRAIKSGQLQRHPPTRDRGGRDRRPAFAGDVVDHIEDAEATPAVELIVHEVQRLAHIRAVLDQDGIRVPIARRRDRRLRTVRPFLR